MSERKSWDVQRRPARVAPSPAPVAAPEPARPSRPRPVSQIRPRAAAPREEKPAPERRPAPRRALQPVGALRERRNRRRRITRYFLLIVLALLVAGGFYLLWQPAFRIESVAASGPGADAAKEIVSTKIAGTYLYLVPRDSIFFYPQSAIRAAILDATPEASAVSLRRADFSALAVTIVPREQSFLWCGASIDAPDPDGCYDADIQGFIFQQADGTASSSMATSTDTRSEGPVRVYAPLSAALADGQSPVRSHVAAAADMPDALKFVDAVRTLDVPVASLSVGDADGADDASLWVNGSTRIRYILGQEKDAADVAASALPTLNLTDGSIEYVDLRFPGKAYVKKYGE